MIVTILIFGKNLSLAQEKEIDRRYKGKEIEFRRFLAQNLKYPVLSQVNGSVGYSISSITITPQGEILDISIINPIDNSIDEDIKRVIKMTGNNWNVSDSLSTNQTFYIQIAYTIAMRGKVSNEINSPVKNGYNFIEPIILTAKTGDKNSLPVSNEYLRMKCDEFFKNENYEEALKCVNELIKRNPFDKKLYQLRISINKRLERKDVLKMQNFIPGVTLDELIN
ncbi:MAG: hypothetical protein A2W90_05085 [Bacteroidetes bacterium GWF2_42_66]|nr:MAG: hypothetical protein A2W92_03260 [Bacteroidetes bacterium GWA2_42_15]OFX95958.1 MAG: hypothetical protein A2W89_02495 [Bacteroidetes bacterium GWE2_42_39]OFY46531.1 MAG: hypothetical protein A2W90_05085 [Bacteroidetes bacterium GWF2_42_66]HBL75616.1 hypothetical protein [Prolixibacteraceae bacterium]HCR89038.1 hypothetical protein [Prolixibacteraceae bacterium]